MQWYNSKTGELQSQAPWGATYLAPSLIAANYGDWAQVADGFVPPAPILTKSQKLTALSVEYTPQILSLNTQISIAVSSTKNTTSEASLRASMAALQSEYNSKRTAIINGTA